MCAEEKDVRQFVKRSGQGEEQHDQTTDEYRDTVALQWLGAGPPRFLERPMPTR